MSFAEGNDVKSLERGGTFSAITSQEAIESAPTADMRAELEAAGVSLPDSDELRRLAQAFYEGFEAFRREWGDKSHGALSWHSVFKEFDNDGSGFVTFDELHGVARHKLKMGHGVMSDIGIKGLWCSLDVDDSNKVLKDEFHAFLKLYVPPQSTEAKFGGQDRVVGQAFGQFIRAGEAIASTPTAQMRDELQKAGTPLPDDEQLTALSRQFNQDLEASRARSQTNALSRAQGSGSWYNLFREVDEDGSGFVTYDELLDVVRRKLGRKPAELSDHALQALWCALDTGAWDTRRAHMIYTCVGLYASQSPFGTAGSQERILNPAGARAHRALAVVRRRRLQSDPGRRVPPLPQARRDRSHG